MTGPSRAANLDEAIGPPSDTRLPSPILDALFTYFVVALTTGALFEPVSAFFISAGADPLRAVLSQATAMLLILLYAAGWVVAGFEIPPRIGPRLAVGAGAMALLLASGVAIPLLILDIWPWELARRLVSPEGAVIAFSLVIGALLPVVRVREPEA